jgi:uncharacterized protein (DUF1330 family)
MSVYFVVHIQITNKSVYQKYLKDCDDVFAQYNGTYLAVDENYKNIEGNIDCTRIVIISFDNENDFDSWYKSEDYQRILKYRLLGAKCNSILVHGK